MKYRIAKKYCKKYIRDSKHEIIAQYGRTFVVKPSRRLSMQENTRNTC